MEIIIGRKGQQGLSITDITVSREHCKLTSNADGTYTLENLSANGTFVDGKSIIRTVVKTDTVIRLGASYSVSVKDLLGIKEQPRVSQPQKPSVPTTNPTEDAKYIAAFNRLRTVYDHYSDEKVAIQKDAAMKNFYRSLPTAITTILFALSMFGGESSFLVQIRPFIGIAMLVFIGLTTFLVYNGNKETPEKLEALNRQFMIDYVCPKCGTFLGYIPFESLQNKKQCTSCKCKWV